MTYRLGLTGSIGTGKSTTAQMFAEAGCALWDADQAVHKLYAAGGAAVAPIAAEFPQAIENNAVSRARLKELIAGDATVLKRLEAIIHPLVAADRQDFLDQSEADITVLEIPLLFETGAERQMDAVVCVTIDPTTQEARVLERGTMTKAQFNRIRDNQMPSEEKCARADYVIVTDTLEHARGQVHSVVQQIREKLADA